MHHYPDDTVITLAQEICRHLPQHTTRMAACAMCSSLWSIVQAYDDYTREERRKERGNSLW